MTKCNRCGEPLAKIRLRQPSLEYVLVDCWKLTGEERSLLSMDRVVLFKPAFHSRHRCGERKYNATTKQPLDDGQMSLLPLDSDIERHGGS